MATLAEQERLASTSQREAHWRRWGPYLSDRAWGTVREDYSKDGTAWEYFPFSHAAAKAYRWGEDGLHGWSDNHQRLCLALALWNGQDNILKERLFGLSNEQGNHGEAVKEVYYTLDGTPTHSYVKLLYKYPQAAFPYQQLLDENQRRGYNEPQFDLLDTGIFNEGHYFDVFTEYAKGGVDDTLMRITIVNRGPDEATLHMLPTLWFRDTWSWQKEAVRPVLRQNGTVVEAEHETLGRFVCSYSGEPELLFTENETNTELLYGKPSGSGLYKDGIAERVLQGRQEAVATNGQGTKCAAWYQLRLAPGEEQTVLVRLTREGVEQSDANQVFASRLAETDEFYGSVQAQSLDEDAKRVQRQAFAGLLQSKQWYHYVVDQWLKGDPAYPPPPPQRWESRNHEWDHLFNEDLLAMPDKWEYPWFAAWDTAFHMIAFAQVDIDFAKRQLSLFLREWYMHPNGQLPAYEWNFSDVNPPVHAWACWRVFEIDRQKTGKPDHRFLEGVFHKLLLNFNWWVNRKDASGNNIFEGGFLGLDNIGVFDRSKVAELGDHLEQSDATSWMAMYALNMLKIAMELAVQDDVYEDIASKFFEHFLYIAAAMNNVGGKGLWDEKDGFYYDRLRLPDGRFEFMQVRSMVGLIPLFAVDTLNRECVEKLPGFQRRMQWFLDNRPDLVGNLAPMSMRGDMRLLALLDTEKLQRILARMLDEAEFLSGHGIRSLSRYHLEHPYRLQLRGQEYVVNYVPGEPDSGLFGGNSNWRGPVWFPVNYLLIESLQRYHAFYGDELQVEFPSGSGQRMHLGEVATELSRRLSRLFLRDEQGRRPTFGGRELMQRDPHFRDHVLFYEYFHGDTGEGQGASHQTGWTALVATLLQQCGG